MADDKKEEVPAEEPEEEEPDDEEDLDDDDLDEEDIASDGEEPGGIMYVRKAALDKIKTHLKEEKELTEKDVDDLTADLAGMPDDEMMVPVDMAAFGEDARLEPAEMKEKLGVKKMAELFVDAHKIVEEAEDDDKAEDMTAAKLKEMMDEQDDLSELDDEDDEDLDDDVEDAEGDDDEEEADEEGGEPEAKKARTE